MLLILMLVLMLILVCCYLGCHLRRGQGGNGARGGVTCTSWDTHISSQPIVVAISSPRRQTGVAQCWYRKVTAGSSTNFVAHQSLLLLGCKRQMCEVQEDGRLYPHRLGHIEHQQKVYHMSDVTDLLHQCIPEWDDSCKTGGMYQRSNIGAVHPGTHTGVQEAPLGYQRHSFWFCYLVAICGEGGTRRWKDTWLPAESGAHRAPAFITWATHRSWTWRPQEGHPQH